MAGKKLTRAQVIRALRRLEQGWPDDLWLFAASGTLHLMRTDADNACVFDPSGSVDRLYSVEQFPGISCDGGDW
jgi:hypothetical protein